MWSTTCVKVPPLFLTSGPGLVLMEHSDLFVATAPPVEGRAVEPDPSHFLDSLGENSTVERCYHSHSRSSVLQGLPFGGVPTVLIINVVLWMVHTHTHTLLKCKKIFSVCAENTQKYTR